MGDGVIHLLVTYISDKYQKNMLSLINTAFIIGTAQMQKVFFTTRGLRNTTFT